MLTTPALSAPQDVRLNAKQPLLAFKLVTTDADGDAVYASAAELGHGGRVLGVSLRAGLSVQVRTAGVVRNPGWSWEPQAPLFVGLEGEITTQQVGRFSQAIGYARTPTEIFVRLGRAILRG